MHLQTSDQPVLKLGIGNYSCNWGVHICGLYETAQERDEIILGFLHQGDVEGDLQLYCPVERSIEQFHTVYEKHCPDCAGHTHDPNRFRINDARSLYYPDGTFSPWAMDRGLNAFFVESQANGKRNIRATAEMSWALQAIPGVEFLMAYEARLNFFIPAKPWISICMYDVTKFSGATILGVLQTHPYAINGGIIVQNPYYHKPEDWLKKYAPQFLPS